MSITASNCFQIAQSPLNQSTSKQLYSFPKDSRFRNHNKSYCTQAFYDLPTQQDKRKAGIGYGSKYDFTKGAYNTPSASHYKQQSMFEVSKQKNLGKTVGVSRDNMPQGGIIQTNTKFVPGPGKYELGTTKSNIKYSFRTKILYGDPFNSPTKKVPGPGTYENNPTLNKTGRYFNSKYKSSGAGLINPSQSARFSKFQPTKDVPGPGQYPSFNMPQNGKYLLSKNKSSAARTFSLNKRSAFDPPPSTPGPGSYRLPSEFGYYESKKRPGTTQSAVGTRRAFNSARQSSANLHAQSQQQNNNQNKETI